MRLTGVLAFFKRQYRRTFVSSLKDIEEVVAASSLTCLNKSTFVGNENDDVFVPMYDWVNFLKPHFRKVPAIKSNHHFMFSADRPGVVVMQLYCGEHQLAVSPCPSQMSPVLVPTGLDMKRQKYLYDEIRQFCREETKDTVCPVPKQPLNIDIAAHDDAMSSQEQPTTSRLEDDHPSKRKVGKRRGRKMQTSN